MKWLLFGSTWHAWKLGAASSVCGMVTHDAGTLADDCTDTLLPEQTAMACKKCRAGVGHTVQDNGLIPGGPNSVAAWSGYIRRHLKSKHVRLDDAEVTEVATRIAAIGTPDNPDAVVAYNQIRELLLTPATWTENGRRITKIVGLRKALDNLPPDVKSLNQVVTAMKTWRAATRGGKLGRFHSDVVVKTILSLPSDVEGYVHSLAEQGLKNLAQFFHPNTLERAKKNPNMRGIFAASDDYWKSNIANLGLTD